MKLSSVILLSTTGMANQRIKITKATIKMIVRLQPVTQRHKNVNLFVTLQPKSVNLQSATQQLKNVTLQSVTRQFKTVIQVVTLQLKIVVQTVTLQ
jgi:hypothetical protein